MPTFLPKARSSPKTDSFPFTQLQKEGKERPGKASGKGLLEPSKQLNSTFLPTHLLFVYIAKSIFVFKKLRHRLSIRDEGNFPKLAPSHPFMSPRGGERGERTPNWCFLRVRALLLHYNGLQRPCVERLELRLSAWLPLHSEGSWVSPALPWRRFLPPGLPSPIPPYRIRALVFLEALALLLFVLHSPTHPNPLCKAPSLLACSPFR